MLAEMTSDRIADKAVVMEFAQSLSLRQSLKDVLKDHNLTEDSMDAIVAHSLSSNLVKNFCIAAQEAHTHPSISIANSSIAAIKYSVDPLCQWFIMKTGLVDALYRSAPNGDMFVSVRVTGARIVFLVSPGQRRVY